MDSACNLREGDSGLLLSSRRIRKRQRRPTSPVHHRRRPDQPWIMRLVCYAAVMQATTTMVMVHGDKTGGSSSPTGTGTNRNTNHFVTPPPPPVFWTETSYYDNTGDDGDDDEESSSSEDEEEFYETWIPLEYASTSTGKNNHKVVKKTKNKPQGNNNPADPRTHPHHQSQPLKTLEKLRQMLDDTDYMTSKPDHYGLHHSSTTTTSTTDPQSTNTGESQSTAAEPQLSATTAEQQRLWTSADRSKYKRQQQRFRQQQHHSPPSSDDDVSDNDDGLGYTLPNLPIYLSDGEAESDAEEQQPTPLPPPPQQQPQQQQHMAWQQPPQQQQQPQYQEAQQQQQKQQESYPPSQPQNMQQQSDPRPQQYYSQQQHFAAWAAAMGYAPPMPYGMAPPNSLARPPPPSIAGKPTTTTTTSASPARNNHMQQAPPPAQQTNPATSTTETTPKQTSSMATQPKSNGAAPKQKTTTTTMLPSPAIITPSTTVTISVQTPPEQQQQQQSQIMTMSRINFDSMQKLVLMAVAATTACYGAVSPRTLPPMEYNQQFFRNMRIASLTFIAPVISFFSVCDATENDINETIQSLYASFSMGYLWVFGLEIFVTTLVRLVVFYIWEQDIFALLPKIPLLVLPWALRENKYRPKRITLLAADFLTSCVACPILEEYIKLKLLQWTTRLPKNYAWTTKKTTTTTKRKKGRKREKVIPPPGKKEVTNVNKYVTQMLAVSIGLKLADAGRRVLMYTKPQHADKSFYALCRGIFPIQELCGTMTALRLAKRDVLGAETPTWWILAPAVIVHGMANFRGMKPIFKWNSATPWSEMQLSPLSAAIENAATLPQLASKAFPKVMWLIIILRVLGYCVKNYYYTNRQAEKRTTIYAGNPCAIDAALASSDYLKKAQGKK
ncbi:solute carrier family 26 [Seminavis robusta]|uniref:Solute carrier family 26 n=1 Tax=Seminavis robusta TaxID=568900 RepID=A0A9N8E407_9STRA|nr:solute carrier family 26 [Seminavis robusta]|eukprot:Sro596_g172820.1 solute carrier family 26 (895) ;mRNA; f:26966-29884